MSIYFLPALVAGGGVLHIIITRGSLKISQPFSRTVSDRQICGGRGVLSENRISIELVGVVNQ